MSSTTEVEVACGVATYCNHSFLTTASSPQNQSPSSPPPSSQVHPDVYYFYSTVQFTVMWVLFFSIVLGNASVIAALLLSKARKSRTNYFIMHLAIADLLVGLLSVLTDIVWKMTVSWRAGNFLCKTIKFAISVVTYSSTYVLVALSIDRYDAITHPMNFSGSWRRARCLVRAAWVLSALFASPSIYLFSETQIKGVPQCWIALEADWQWQIYVTLVTLVIFIIPFVIITACYFVIVYTIWSKSKVMTITQRTVHKTSQNGEKKGGSGGCDGGGGEDDSRRASSRGLIPKAKIKTVKMTFVIVFVFVMCWSPYFVFNMLQVFHALPTKTKTLIAVSTFVQSLAPLNSAANPIIYCLFSTHLCRNLRRIKALDVLVRALCPCSTCTKRGFDSQGQIHRSATDYTTMSEVSTSKKTQTTTQQQPPPQAISSVRFSCRYTRVRNPTMTTTTTTTTRNQRQVLDIELLRSPNSSNDDEDDHKEGGALLVGSAV